VHEFDNIKMHGMNVTKIKESCEWQPSTTVCLVYLV